MSKKSETGIPNQKTDLEKSINESVVLLKKILNSSEEDRSKMISSIEDAKLRTLISFLLNQVNKIDGGKEKISKIIQDESWISKIFSDKPKFVDYMKSLPEEAGRLIMKTGILNFLNKLKPNSGGSSNTKAKVQTASKFS